VQSRFVSEGAKELGAQANATGPLERSGKHLGKQVRGGARRGRILSLRIAKKGRGNEARYHDLLELTA
jgi:hypothetical protein